MALVVYDRVQETTTTSGTGTITLLGAVSGFQSFAVVGNGNTTYYTITDGAQWEVGIGTYSTSGPTLARTTVISNSLGTTSPITLSGGLTQVFVTYPAEKSVNLDASGNVTPLGTIASGTWQGTTVGVSYGGTGVTASSGANSVMLRDANANTLINNIVQGWTSTVSAAGTTTLTAASTYWQRLTGTTTQTFKLPDATTLTSGTSYIFDNDSTANLFIVDNGSNAIDTVAPGGYTTVFLESTSTSNGEWGRFGMLPNEVNWGTLSADLGGTTITNATWNGVTVGTGYGGTGLTSFTSGGALYATSTSALTSGTLPVTAGGVGISTYTIGDLLYASGTTTLSKLGIGTNGYVLTSSGTGPQWTAAASVGVTSISFGSTGLTPSTATQGAVTVGGTLAIGYGGTGQTTASAAFNALSPITSTGDLILGNGVNSATRLGIGSNNYVLTSNGTTASWQATQSTMVYPGAGIPNSTGSAWGTSYSTTGSGTVVALATTPTFVTSITSPLVLGGTGTGSSLTLQSTSGVGATDSIALKVGNNGATTALSISSAGVVTLSSALPVASGGTGQTTYTDGQLLIGNTTGNTLTKSTLTAGTGISITNGSGAITIASTVTSGLTITNDTTTATALYPTFTSATSGTITGASVTSTKLKFVPSTGTLTAPNVEASNGMLVNSYTVSTNYSIPSGSNAIAVGPVTVAAGAAVTIPSGSRWLVL